MPGTDLKRAMADLLDGEPADAVDPNRALRAGRTALRAHRAKVAASAVVAGVVVAAVAPWGISAMRQRADLAPVGPAVVTSTPTPAPAHLPAPGPIIVTGASDPSGQRCTMRAIDPVTGRATPVVLRPAVACGAQYVWARDGRAVAGLVDGKLWVWVTASGLGRELDDCSHCTGLTWSSDSRSVSVVADSSTLVTYDIATGVRRHAFLPEGDNSVVDAAVSPDGSQVVAAVGYCPTGATCPGEQGTAALVWAIDLITMATGERVTVLQPTGRGALPVSLQWSPAGTSIAYVELDMRPGTAETRVRVKAIDPRSGNVTTVHDSGATCYCIGASPSLAWAPDGSALAASVPVGTLDAGWAVYVVRADGTGWRRVPGTGFSWLGWRPRP